MSSNKAAKFFITTAIVLGFFGTAFPLLVSASSRALLPAAVTITSGGLVGIGIMWMLGYLRLQKPATVDQKKQLQSAYFELSPDMHCVANVEGYFVFVNSAFTEVLGWSEEELLSRPYLSFVHPHDKSATSIEARSLAAGRRAINFRNRYEHKNGGYVSLAWNAITGENGMIYASARHNADGENSDAGLNQERALLKAVVDTAVDGIITIDELGEILSVNRSAVQIFGYQVEELIGQNVRILMPEPYRSEHSGYLKNYKDTGIAKVIGIGREVTGLRKDGSEFPLELAVSATEIAGRRIYTGVVRDITARKRIEETLFRAKEDAERANMAKSEFLSRMSHELRTPLNAMLGYAQLLEMRSKDQFTISSAHSIMKGGRHLLDLINEVLDLARIEAGKLSISLEPVSLKPTIDQAIEMVRPLAEERGINIRHESDTTKDVMVKADKQRLLQVVLNLVSNAAKYNRPNGEIVIRGMTVDDRIARVEIADTGTGFDETSKNLLFKPFERHGHEGVEGTGLGLSLSKHLMELSNGKLELVETSSNGSTFAIELPIAVEGRVTVDADWLASEGVLARYSKRIRIVCIEDNGANLELLENIFAGDDRVELITASTAKAGAETVREQLPDLVLLDLHLPDAHGIKVLTELKADINTSHIPIVILSADATHGQITRALAEGASTYLTKPINLVKLLNIIDEIGAEQRKVA